MLPISNSRRLLCESIVLRRYLSDTPPSPTNMGNQNQPKKVRWWSISGQVERLLLKTKAVEDPDTARLIGRSSSIGVLSLVGMSALGTVGVDTAPLLTGIGVTGFTIGFALKEIATNFLSGMLLVISRPFRKGQHLRVMAPSISGGVIEGDVVSIDASVEEKGAVYFYDRKHKGELPIFALIQGTIQHPQQFFSPERKQPTFGILGVLENKADGGKILGRYVMLIKERQFQTFLFRNQHPIYSITKVAVCRIDGHGGGRDDFATTVESYYADCKMTYSPKANLSSRKNLTHFYKELNMFDEDEDSLAFAINKNILKFFKSNMSDQTVTSRLVIAILGFVETAKLVLSMDRKVVYTAFLSCLSPDRVGTRYGTRGADAHGNVANHVETTILIAYETSQFIRIATFVQVRGSVPLLWKQKPTLKKITPSIKITETEVALQRDAFRLHLEQLKRRHGNPVTILNLLSQKWQSKEDILGQTFLNLSSENTMFRYDLHKNGIEGLTPLLRETILSSGFDLTIIEDGKRYKVMEQRGVVRTNCLDCLDRTNRAQTAIAMTIVPQMFYLLHIPDIHHSTIEDWVRKQWLLNGNALSKLSCGSNALTGGNTYGSKAKDIHSSIQRYYNDRFTSEFREVALDCLRFVESDNRIAVLSPAFRLLSLCEDYCGFGTVPQSEVENRVQYQKTVWMVLLVRLTPDYVLLLAVNKSGLPHLIVASILPNHLPPLAIPLYRLPQ